MREKVVANAMDATTLKGKAIPLSADMHLHRVSRTWQPWSSMESVQRSMSKHLLQHWKRIGDFRGCWLGRIMAPASHLSSISNKEFGESTGEDERSEFGYTAVVGSMANAALVASQSAKTGGAIGAARPSLGSLLDRSIVSKKRRGRCGT